MLSKLEIQPTRADDSPTVINAPLARKFAAFQRRVQRARCECLKINQICRHVTRAAIADWRIWFVFTFAAKSWRPVDPLFSLSG